MPVMSSQTRLPHPGSAARLQAVLWLALLALALRALIPAGYMPDSRALHDGTLPVHATAPAALRITPSRRSLQRSLPASQMMTPATMIAAATASVILIQL